jgi:hypothetical protein
MNVHHEIDSTRGDTGEEIKDQELAMTQAILHRTAEQMKEPHIPYDMQPSFMQKHVGQKGEVIIERKAVDVGPPGVGVPGRDKAEEIKHRPQNIFGNGDFKEENDPVYSNQSPGNGRKSCAENGVFQGKHVSIDRPWAQPGPSEDLSRW